MSTFSSRINTGRAAEMKIFAYLCWWGIDAKYIGQETWMSSWLHNKLRYINDDGPKMIKHFPDIDTGKALIQVKAAPDGNSYPTLTIEEDSYNTCKILHGYDIPVLIIWLVGSDDLVGNFVQDINTKIPKTPRHEANGSHTPFFIINKNDLKPLKDFKEYLAGGK